MLRRLLVIPAALVLSGAGALLADTLVMQDGRRIRGELVSVANGTVVFDQNNAGNAGNAGSFSRARRIRVRQTEVDRIDFTDQGINDNDNGDFGYRGDRDPGYRVDRDSGFGGNRNGARERTVSVSADRRWTDTGLDVRAGQTIQFDAQGTVLWGSGRQDGPEGEANSPFNQSRPIPSRAGGALIGRIGNSNDVFFIGSDTGQFRVRNSGRLFLGVNDDYLQDNSGAFQVRVMY